MTHWQWSRFEDLSPSDIYQILKIRQEVFVLEQDCAYLDADNLDMNAWHLIVWNKNDQGKSKISGYLRIVYPGLKYKEPAIGRLLTDITNRNRGLGKQLMEKALTKIQKEYPACSTRISAQTYLIDFYTDLGFKTINHPYDEDGIPHIEMLHEVAKV